MQQQQEPQDSANTLQPLQQKVIASLGGYFSQVGNNASLNLYDMFVSEIEEPLFKAVMQFCDGNQSKAATLLGLSRGTLRKKLKQYDLINPHE